MKQTLMALLLALTMLLGLTGCTSKKDNGTKDDTFLQSWARSKEFTPQGKSLDDYFDNLFLSYKMNCSKPGDDIYLKMLSDGRMKPEETLFIDDGEKNIETASRLGINVLHVRNGEDWRPLLKNILSNDKQI